VLYKPHLATFKQQEASGKIIFIRLNFLDHKDITRKKEMINPNPPIFFKLIKGSWQRT
jgi:2-keto-4-pentenoate hydratase/2-oxohepta-3-ene-1,7-dioic acid hydratase in catechol pathway